MEAFMKRISSTSRADSVISTLEVVQKKFQAWRQDPSQSQRIPEELWHEAAGLVGTGPSLNHISRTLSVDYNHLKRRSLAMQLGNDGLVEIPLPDMFPQQAISPLAEIVSQNGVVLRLFSQECGSIIKAFLK